MWIILASAAGLLALLAIPLELALFIHYRDERYEHRITLLWLFRAVRLRLDKPKRKHSLPPTSTRSKQHPRKFRENRHILAQLLSENFVNKWIRLASNLIRQIQIRELSLVMRLGLNDPADTGLLWAAIGPLSAMVMRPSLANITIEPDFATEIFEAEGHGRIRIIPLKLLFVIVTFVLTPSTLRLLRSMRAAMV